MKPPKRFDCVQLKWQIQEQLANEFAGVSEEEAQRRLNERVMADPILGPLINSVLKPLVYKADRSAWAHEQKTI